MYKNKRILAIIPARGGSKGLPGKNIKEFAGKPLILWTVDAIKTLLDDEFICISTDDDNIIATVESHGLKVPFKRPFSLSGDTSSINDVVRHAINFYKEKGFDFDWVLLLQPTSPLRNREHIEEVLKMSDANADTDMIVSVKESHAPAVLCEETVDGFLEKTINKNGTIRQHLPHYYEYNGAIYLMNVNALLENGIHGIRKVRKYVMNPIESIDIDDINDFELAEYYKIKYKL